MYRMTNRPIEARGASRPPRFPKDVTTCRAAVLACLLAPGEFDTAGMFAPGTICLNVVMRALVRRYRWPVVRIDFATGTGWATSWSLAPDVAGAALDAHGLAWLAAFRTERATHDRRFVGAVAAPMVTR